MGPAEISRRGYQIYVDIGKFGLTGFIANPIAKEMGEWIIDVVVRQQSQRANSESEMAKKEIERKIAKIQRIGGKILRDPATACSSAKDIKKLSSSIDDLVKVISLVKAIPRP